MNGRIILPHVSQRGGIIKRFHAYYPRLLRNNIQFVALLITHSTQLGHASDKSMQIKISSSYFQKLKEICFKNLFSSQRQMSFIQNHALY